jgi:type I restriction enzyme S subunit
MPSRGSKQLAKISSELDAIRLETEHGLADDEFRITRAPETLPTRWLKTTIGEICEVNPPKPNADELPDDAEVSFVPMAAVDADLGLIVAPEVRVAGEIRKRFRGFREGDVLMAKITPSMENGKAAVAIGLVGGYGFGTSEFHVLRPFGGLPPEYVFFFLRRRSFREEAAVRMSGKAGQKRVPAGFLEGHDIPLAPPLAQANIVSRLLGLDKARRATVQRLAEISPLLEETRTMVRIDCFNGLGESDPSGEESRSRGGAEELPSPPNGWEWATIGEVATRLQYGTSARSDVDAHTGVPNIGMRNIRAGKLDLTEVRYVDLTAEERESHRLTPGDVLFNRTNSPELVGKAAVVEDIGEAVFASYLIRVELDRARVEPAFVAHWINSPWGRAWARRVKRDAISQSNINGRKLATMPVPLPPLAEQRSIVTEIDELLGRVEELERRRGEVIGELDRLWESTLEGAFLGAFDGEEPAPAEAETAVEQLARARAEREDERMRHRKARRKPRVASAEKAGRVEATTPGDGFDREVASLSSGDFSFEELQRRLDVRYDQAVNLLFERLEDPYSTLRQKFDARRGEMRLTGSKR